MVGPVVIGQRVGPQHSYKNGLRQEEPVSKSKPVIRLPEVRLERPLLLSPQTKLKAAGTATKQTGGTIKNSKTHSGYVNVLGRWSIRSTAYAIDQTDTAEVQDRFALSACYYFAGSVHELSAPECSMASLPSSMWRMMPSLSITKVTRLAKRRVKLRTP